MKLNKEKSETRRKKVVKRKRENTVERDFKWHWLTHFLTTDMWSSEQGKKKSEKKKGQLMKKNMTFAFKIDNKNCNKSFLNATTYGICICKLLLT